MFLLSHSVLTQNLGMRTRAGMVRQSELRLYSLFLQLKMERRTCLTLVPRVLSITDNIITFQDMPRY